MENSTKNKIKAKKNSPKEIKALSESQKRDIEKWRQRDNERVDPPKFKKIKDKIVTYDEENPDKFWSQMKETTGSYDVDFFKTILGQAGNTMPDRDSEEVSNFVASFMHGLKPKDETEGVLIAQMAGTHNLLMEYMSRAILPGQYLEAANDYTNRACKLMNIFLKQLETLEKYRGKTAQQKVTVEHVHIHEGGKAIVGHVENKPQGGGDEPEK